MNKHYVEFDDLDVELWLDRVANDGIVVVVTVQSVPRAAIVPLSLWEKLERLEEDIENAA